MPIDLNFEPDVIKFGHEVREWALAEIRPHARAVDRDHRPPPREVIESITAAAPIDLRTPTPAPVPATSMQLSQGPATVGTVLYENISYGDQWFMWEMPSSGIGALSVNLLGTEAQKKTWVGGIAEGTYSRTAFALTEPSFGSDASKVATTAVRDGDMWLLNGSKMYCSAGYSSDYVVVFATVDKAKGAAGIRGFVVEKGTPGFSVPKVNESKLGLRGAETSELLFENAAIPLENCLGWTGDDDGDARGKSGFIGAITTLDSSRPAMSSIGIGIASAGIDEAAKWFAQHRAYFTQERRDRIEADLDTLRAQLATARLFVTRATQLKDAGLPNRREASIAKAYGPPVAEQVLRRCIQIMGPDGWSENYLVEKWYRDVKILDIFEGSGQIQRMIIARESMGRSAARG
ncbi:MAG: acyl-CoA dehydrogenase [Mycobacterium sp.]|nr:acyl-CoA dehydrogenase [Mycobacterium sp.]